MDEMYYCTSCGTFYNSDVIKISQPCNEKSYPPDDNFEGIHGMICPKCGMHKVVHVDRQMKESVIKLKEINDVYMAYRNRFEKLMRRLINTLPEGANDTEE